MKRSFFFVAAALVALLPATADAQLTTVPNVDEYFTFVNASSAVVSTGLTSNVMVGPYVGSFGSGNFPIYCVDYLHYANNSTGDVKVYGVGGDLGNVSTTRFDDPVRYRQAAYLASMFDGYAGQPNQRTAWSAIHAAIWATTSGVAVGTGTVGTWAALLYNEAETAVTNGYMGNDWYVISSVELAGASYANGNYDRTGQEFLVRRVPEPGTVLLMLTGLMMLVGVSRKRAFDLGSL